MGDWGGKSDDPYYTGPEHDTAGSMDCAASDLRAKFALALGDNFYGSGVRSVDDPRFQETFEDVFKGDALAASSGFHFHVVAGNHDHRGNVTAQVAYSARSERWAFPSPYYTFSETAPDGTTVQFVMFDSVILSGNSQVPNGDQLPGDRLPGPEDKAAASAQLAWIEDTLARSEADYLVVAGHYPMYSICEHGPTESLQSELLPVLKLHEVSAYLSGHDHCQEYIDVGDGIQYHVIGSAHIGDSSTAHRHTLEDGQLKFHNEGKEGGFASVSVSQDGLQVTHYDGFGHAIYTAPTQVPRRKRGTPEEAPIVV